MSDRPCLPKRLSIPTLLLSVAALFAASCSTVGDAIAAQEASPIAFNDETVPEVEEPEEETVADPDEDEPVVDIGKTFPAADAGPTLVAAGRDGVWWFDADGASQLLVEPAISADYDGNGGLVFQRAGLADVRKNGAGGVDGDDTIDTTIVHHTNTAEQFALVIPAVNEALELHGVTSLANGTEAIFTRHTFGGDGGDVATLERVNISSGEVRELVTVAGSGESFSGITISGSYASGIVASPDSHGWIIYELTSGGRLSGSSADEATNCAAGPSEACVSLIAINEGGDTLYRVFPSGEDLSGYTLVVSQASDGSETATIDLEAEAGTWFPHRVEPVGDLIVVSRSADPEGRVPVAALVINPATGEITQLSEDGFVSIIAAG